MVAEADEQLMEKFFEAGSLTDEELVAGLRGAVAAAKVFPLVCVSGLLNVGVQPLLDVLVSYVPSPADRPFTGVDRSGAEQQREGRRQGARRGVRVEDRCRPVRGPNHHVPRGLGRVQVGLHGPQQDEGLPGALRQPAAASGKDPDHGSRAQGGRPRRGRQAEGHADQRHARRQERRDDVPAAQVPGAGAVVRHRTEEPRRRGQDQHRRCTASRKRIRRSSTAAIPRPRSCCCRARGSCTSR